MSMWYNKHMEIHGFRHRMKTRCDFCHRPTEYPYVVNQGPTTGKFCSAAHFTQAKQAMDTQQLPEHEVK